MAKGTASGKRNLAETLRLPRRSDAWPRSSDRDVCLEIQDQDAITKSATVFFGIAGRERNSSAAAARLAEQFVRQNEPLLQSMEVRIDREFDGDDVYLVLRSGNMVGAIPLVSPTTASQDYGLVIQPRFPWIGIGPMLAEMGWRVAPCPLRLPLLKRSERRVPPWVLASMILTRMKAMLDAIERRFEIIDASLPAPRGRVNWTSYAVRNLPRAKVAELPCTFPDLRDDRSLLGAIRHTLEKQVRSLDSQRQHGAHVHRLIDFAQAMLRKVSDVAPVVPGPTQLTQWMQRPMRRLPIVEGVQAIEWTVEGRGLAGISDLEGVPWRLAMEQFFEAWVETVFHSLAKQVGGVLRAGRKRETREVLQWHPSYDGAHRSLIPDIQLTHLDTTLIIDAKYKRHWEEWHWGNWAHLEKEIREDHRHDFHQILAYANLSRTPRTIACLCYPCSPETWERMKDHDREIYRTKIPTVNRDLEVWITAIPMSGNAREVAERLARWM